MNVSVFGLGYVGCVSAASFAGDGHHVIGVDVNPDKVDAVNAGRSPIVEPGLDELLAAERGRRPAARDHRHGGRDPRHATSRCCASARRAAGTAASISPISSASPSRSARRSRQSRPITSSSSAARCCRERPTRWSFPALERTSGKKYGDGFGVSVNPEFLREGTALKDFRKPPLTLVGHNHAADASGDDRRCTRSVEAPLISTSIRVAEMMKYTSNTWHALKVVFANEIGNLCKKLNVDSHEVMDIFCRDEKLNLSPYYLKPGFAFGGSCLPKDVRALQYRAKRSWTSSCR